MKEKELTSTAEVIETVEPAAPAAPAAPAVSALPDGYLVGGYYAPASNGEKYLKVDYVGSYAVHIAAALAPMKPSDFNTLMREMKRSKKRTLPFEARQTATYELMPKAATLVRRGKAPKLLLDMITENLEAIHNDEDWTAFYRHLEAIVGYLYAGGGIIEV